MPNDFYLDGYVYHMTHFDNIKSILHRYALLSKERGKLEKITYHSIAEESVQDLRDRIYIWDFPAKKWRSVHSYVPFYFAKLTPMLFKRVEMQRDILFFGIHRSILKSPGVVFTDGNVANQQLAKFGTERVYIVPATSRNPLCRRGYSPRGPLGANSNCSNVYADLDFLARLNWDVINDRWFNDGDDKPRIKHSEVLVPDIVPLSKVEGISTLTQERANAVNELIKQCGLAGCIPKAVSQPDLYF